MYACQHIVIKLSKADITHENMIAMHTRVCITLEYVSQESMYHTRLCITLQYVSHQVSVSNTKVTNCI